MENQDRSKYHVVLLLGGKMEHFASTHTAQVLEFVAQRKPADGYLLFRGSQLRSVLDMWELTGLAAKDVTMLADVTTWEAERSPKALFTDDQEDAAEEGDGSKACIRAVESATERI